MNEPFRPRSASRGRWLFPRAGLCVTGAATMLCAALLSSWLRSAAAQQQPPAGQAPPASTIPPPNTGAPEAQAKEKAEEPPTPAEILIDDAKIKLAKLQSAAANVEERVDMLNQHFTLKGNYFKAPGYRVYFRLTLNGLADSGGTTLQVCDGETLWDYEAVLESTIYHKFSVKPVMERLSSPELDSKVKDEFREGMGFAGPETLLVGLRRLFRFNQGKEESKIGDRPVWILRGEWKDRKGLTGPDQRQVNLFGMLPPYVPKLVVLHLGKDDGWPYKLELLGQAPSMAMDTRKVGPDGRPIGARSSIETVAPTKIVLEYSDVKLNPAIDVSQFAFEPPAAAPVEDGTEMIVKRLDSIIAMQAERKKADAAKKEGPVLEHSLEIPPPPGALVPDQSAKP
jgi:outer membrane lipoprotein-sorting protein